MIFSDENIPLLFATMAFVVLCLLSAGIIVYYQGARHRRAMLRKIQQSDSEWEVIEKDTLPPESSDGSGNAFVRFMSAIGMKTNPGRSVDDADIKLKFLRAGLRGRNVPTVFWGTKFALAVSLPMCFIMLALFFIRTLDSLQLLMVGAFLTLFGLFLPDMWLHVRTSRRKERIFKAFPDALDLLVVCVEAGMGLDAAINRVGEDLGLSHPDLGQELKLLNLELRAGKPRVTALRSLANRIEVDDVSNLVTLLIQTDRFGTSVAQALRVFSDSFRTTRYQRAEELAAKIGTKLIFPLALCLFPSFFIIAIGPALIQVYRVLLKG